MPARSKPKSTGELALIDRIRARAAKLPQTPELVFGIGDDCAILQPNLGEELVVTTDFCLEDRHWTRAWNSPQSVGHRTLARGLSDLAAMGARPIAAFLSLSLPTETARDEVWVDGFLDGLLTLAAEHHCSLAGGDTSQSPSPHVLADITCLGACPTGPSGSTALRRSTARPGDILYVTGALGGSYAERTLTAAGTLPTKALATNPFLYPQPRLATGQALREQDLATACIDLSDGLSTDLHHLCESADVAAELDLAVLPASLWLRHIPAAQRQHAMLHGGEDYELLFTAAPKTRLPSRLGGVRLTPIGVITRRTKSRFPVTAIGPESRERISLRPQGWEHLK